MVDITIKTNFNPKRQAKKTLKFIKGTKDDLAVQRLKEFQAKQRFPKSDFLTLIGSRFGEDSDKVKQLVNKSKPLEKITFVRGFDLHLIIDRALELLESLSPRRSGQYIDGFRVNFNRRLLEKEVYKQVVPTSPEFKKSVSIQITNVSDHALTVESRGAVATARTKRSRKEFDFKGPFNKAIPKLNREFPEARFEWATFPILEFGKFYQYGKKKKKPYIYPFMVIKKGKLKSTTNRFID